MLLFLTILTTVHGGVYDPKDPKGWLHEGIVDKDCNNKIKSTYKRRFNDWDQYEIATKFREKCGFLPYGKEKGNKGDAPLSLKYNCSLEEIAFFYFDRGHKNHTNMNELLEQYYKGDTEPKIIWIGQENGVKLNTRYAISATDLAQKLFDNWDGRFKQWDKTEKWKDNGKFDTKLCKMMWKYPRFGCTTRPPRRDLWYIILPTYAYHFICVFGNGNEKGNQTNYLDM